jgi:hypothetical protein
MPERSKSRAEAGCRMFVSHVDMNWQELEGGVLVRKEKG